MTNFRNYQDCDLLVKDCYKKQRINQNIDFVKFCIKKYCIFDKISSFWELFDDVKIKDLSDPDISLPNYYHLFQTAEGIRKDGHPEWMQLVGLIHDLGKIMYKKGCDKDGTSEKEQWGMVGDTFIVGCKIPDTVVFNEFNTLNIDNKRFTKLGIYQKNIGLNNVYCSFGHDEYLYRLLKFNNIKLPEEAYYMIRFHSLYLWHKENEYSYFENDKDSQMKEKVQLFNKYDLYTKKNEELDITKLKKYYNKIVKKYLPDKIYW